MITTSTRVEDARLREMLAACEGVTPGPWDNDEPNIVYSMANGACVYLANTADLDTPYRQQTSDAKHIANCDPDTIRSILSELLELREAVKGVLEHRVGALPERGWLKDTDASRAAIDKLARSLSQGAGHEQ